MSDSITLVLPYPLSANRYWKSCVPKGYKSPIVYVTAEAKAYKTEVRWIARQAGMRKPLQCRVKVHIDLYPQMPQDVAKRARTNPDYWDDNVRCIDLDNARKVLYDALQGVVIENDERIWEDSAKRMQPDGEARVVVTVTRLEKILIQPPLFAASMS